MNPCAKIIEEIYLHPKVNELIGNIKPVELQDDLRQEMAMVLLKYDCDKLMKIESEGNLLPFVLRIVWNMGTLTKGEFYKVFKKNDADKAFEYIKSFEGKGIPGHHANIARKILEHKLTLNANDAHESIIFSKYVELKSCNKVAEYFGIPHLHVSIVVRKTKKELKTILNKL
jgi:hypothetical protein